MTEIFQIFIIEEDEHVNFFQKIFDEMKCDSVRLNVAKPDDLRYLESLAKSPIAQGGDKTINSVKNAATSLEVVTNALVFEHEAMLFFVKLYRLVCEDDRKSISKIVQEKESHIKTLNELQKKLKNQRPTSPGGSRKE
jgi:rubrerythrin